MKTKNFIHALLIFYTVSPLSASTFITILQQKTASLAAIQNQFISSIAKATDAYRVNQSNISAVIMQQEITNLTSAQNTLITLLKIPVVSTPISNPPTTSATSSTSTPITPSVQTTTNQLPAQANARNQTIYNQWISDQASAKKAAEDLIPTTTSTAFYNVAGSDIRVQAVANGKNIGNPVIISYIDTIPYNSDVITVTAPPGLLTYTISMQNRNSINVIYNAIQYPFGYQITASATNIFAGGLAKPYPIKKLSTIFYNDAGTIISVQPLVNGNPFNKPVSIVYTSTGSNNSTIVTTSIMSDQTLSYKISILNQPTYPSVVVPYDASNYQGGYKVNADANLSKIYVNGLTITPPTQAEENARKRALTNQWSSDKANADKIISDTTALQIAMKAIQVAQNNARVAVITHEWTTDTTAANKTIADKAAADKAAADKNAADSLLAKTVASAQAHARTRILSDEWTADTTEANKIIADKAAADKAAADKNTADSLLAQTVASAQTHARTRILSDEWTADTTEANKVIADKAAADKAAADKLAADNLRAQTVASAQDRARTKTISDAWTSDTTAANKVIADKAAADKAAADKLAAESLAANNVKKAQTNGRDRSIAYTWAKVK